MYLKIFCLTLLVGGLRCSSWIDDDAEEISGNGGKAPFFEIPCMRVGGTCARKFACPPGTVIGETGLCPEQQRQGMECCRPLAGGWGVWQMAGRLTKRSS